MGKKMEEAEPEHRGEKPIFSYNIWGPGGRVPRQSKHLNPGNIDPQLKDFGSGWGGWGVEKMFDPALDMSNPHYYYPCEVCEKGILTGEVCEECEPHPNISQLPSEGTR